MPTSYFFDVFGLRWASLIAAVLVAVGCAVRLLALVHGASARPPLQTPPHALHLPLQNPASDRKSATPTCRRRRLDVLSRPEHHMRVLHRPPRRLRLRPGGEQILPRGLRRVGALANPSVDAPGPVPQRPVRAGGHDVWPRLICRLVPPVLPHHLHRHRRRLQRPRSRLLQLRRPGAGRHARERG
jgi:hypothetical protein